MKAKMLAYAAIIVTLLMVAAKSFTPESIVSDVDTAFSGAIDPANDNTAKWRMGIQLVALQQAFETFWLGQGFGSYFNFVVAEKYRSIWYEATPHNQFLVIFLKTGIIGVLLLVALLMVYVYKSLKMLSKLPNTSKEKIYVLLLLVIISSQLFYGMTYDFIPIFGVYYGFGALLIRSIKLNPVISMVNKENTL
jgi:O-antigen ligase